MAVTKLSQIVKLNGNFKWFMRGKVLQWKRNGILL